MGTKQHFVLFEHASGYSLFRIKEFDEITRTFSAHVNSFIKPVAHIHFSSIYEAIENVQTVSDGIVSDLLRQFLRSNIVAKSSVLGVSDEALGKAILASEFGFECVWHGAVREILRVIRQNYARLLKSLVAQPGHAHFLAHGSSRVLSRTGAEELAPGRLAESRARLVVGMTRARLQLHLTQHLADTAVVRALTLIDELDVSLTRSASRLRASYTYHFPEVCRASFTSCPCLVDRDLIQLIACCPSRSDLSSEDQSKLAECLSSPGLYDLIRDAARNSIGGDLADMDAENLRSFAARLLKMMQMRQRYADLLARRVESLVPNLHALLKSTLPSRTTSDDNKSLTLADTLSSSLVAARLIAHAGSLTRLANMPTSRILSLGASRALFRKSGAMTATSTGLLATATRTNSLPVQEQCGTVPLTASQLKALSGNRLQPNTVCRRAARLLAAKSSLACRADCFRGHNPAKLADVTEASAVPEEDPRLATGAFGTELGREVRHQLRVWAEANGVHMERTEEEKRAQRIRRKKYRKLKRKAWLTRKLTRSRSETEVVRQPTNLPKSLVQHSDAEASPMSCESPSQSEDPVLCANNIDADVDMPSDDAVNELPDLHKSFDASHVSPDKPLITRKSLRVRRKQLSAVG